MKKQIITIAGKLGSGKSTTAKKVANILNFKHYSTGDFMRQMAKDRNLTLEDLTKEAEKNHEIDKELDDYNKELGNQTDIVLDSRLGFYFIPESFKVFLELDTLTSAKRILKDKEINNQRSEESKSGFNTEEEIAESINNRLISERKRYFEKYRIKDQTDPHNFDLVINTGLPEYDGNIEAVVNKIINEYKEWIMEDNNICE